MQTRTLYVMISETDTAVGHMIRHFSGYSYNHVALTLDSTLRHWYAFARFSIDAPFYSGFLMEPVERYLANGFCTPVRIFRLEIPQRKAKHLELLFARAERRDSGLVYNYFDAAAAYFGHKFSVSGAYTCLGFACAVLEKNYLSIRALNDGLDGSLYYEGNLSELVPDSGCREDAYFQPIGLLRGVWESSKEVATLTYRVFSRGDDLVQRQLHSIAQ